MSNITNRIRRQVISLEAKYNPEFDLIPNTPVVTHTDNELLDMICSLCNVVEELEKQVDELKGQRQ